MNLFVFYRISDKGNPKEKLPNCDKFSCLKNAVNVFGAENFHVIADNCEPATIDFIKSFSAKGLTLEETSLGNSGSFMYMADKIIKTLNKDDFVYLLEDDYIHKPDSKKIILEGLQIADYVTLYDHPDKYRLDTNGGNHFNHKKLQRTRLYLTESTHWRECNSSTMTFACKVQTLIDNHKIWKKYTKGSVPRDNLAFYEISQCSLKDMFSFLFRFNKRIFLILFRNQFRRGKIKKIISALPACSTHAETKFISPVVDWKTFSETGSAL